MEVERTELNGPNVGRVQSQFNALGQLTWTQDNAADETTREYDLLGRLEWQIAGDDVVRYTYDEDGGLGQVASVMYNGDYQTVYTYDGGRLTDVAQKMKGGHRTVTGTSLKQSTLILSILKYRIETYKRQPVVSSHSSEETTGCIPVATSIIAENCGKTLGKIFLFLALFSVE